MNGIYTHDGFTRVYCSAFPQAPSCCHSCHDEEDDYGRPLSSGWWLDNDQREVGLCCAVGNWLKEQPDEGRELVAQLEALETASR